MARSLLELFGHDAVPVTYRIRNSVCLVFEMSGVIFIKETSYSLPAITSTSVAKTWSSDVVAVVG